MPANSPNPTPTPSLRPPTPNQILSIKFEVYLQKYLLPTTNYYKTLQIKIISLRRNYIPYISSINRLDTIWGIKIIRFFYTLSKYPKAGFMSLIMLTTSLFGLLTLTLVMDECGTVSASNNIYVDLKGHGDYTSIQTAIDNANSGDTIYVWAGTYYEYVFVNKTVTIIGNGTTNTTISCLSNCDTISVNMDLVNITGLTINAPSTTKPNAGIRLNGAKNCTLSNINIPAGNYGLYLNHSSENTIDNVTCSTTDGIYL